MSQQSKSQPQMTSQSQSQPPTGYSQYPAPSYSTKATPAAYDGYGEFKRNDWPAQSSFPTSLGHQEDFKNDNMKKEGIYKF